MESRYHHILLNTGEQKDDDRKALNDENYRQLFSKFPPSKILVFNPIPTQGLNSGLVDIASEHDVQPQEEKIEGVKAGDNWTREELATKPHRILSAMIDGWKNSDLDRNKVLVTIVGGTSLHSSLLLVFSRIIDATVVLNEGNLQNPHYESQSWLSRVEQYTQIKPKEIKTLHTFLKSKSNDNFSKITLLRENDLWKSATDLSGSDIDASKAKGIHQSISPLIEKELVKLRKGTKDEPAYYRLTAKGWTTALSHYTLISNEITNVLPCQILGFRLPGKFTTKHPPKEIAQTLLRSVDAPEEWLPILGREQNQEHGGIPLFDDKADPSQIMEEKNQEIFNKMRKIWLEFLDDSKMTECSWGLLDVVDEVEETFCEFCEWIWPRLTGGNTRRHWKLDLTQFTNKQIPLIAHFAFSLGIPLTWTAAPDGYRGVHGAVHSDVKSRSLLITSIPNLDFSKYLLDGGKESLEVKIKMLISLLYQEEKYKSDNAGNLDVADPYTNPIPEEKGVLGADMKKLAEDAEDNIDRPDIREKLMFKPNKTEPQRALESEGFITIESREKSGKHHLTLTPLGRLVARILRDRMLSTMEKE